MSRGTLVAAFLLALAVRTGIAIAHPPPLDLDQRNHLDLATSMARGEGYVAEGRAETHIQPLVPALLAVAIRAMPVDPEIASRIVALILSALLAPACGAAFAAALGPREGIAAAAAVALEPHLALRGAYLEPEATAALLAAWLSLALLRARAELSGSILGFLFLTRPEWIFVAPVGAIALVRRGVPARRLAGGAAILAGLVAVVPLYLHALGGEWGISGKTRWVYLNGVHQWRSGNRPLPQDEVPALAREIGSPLSHAAAHPSEFVQGYLYRSWLLARNLARALDVVLVPLAVAGLALALAARPAAAAALAVPLAVLPVLPIGATYFRHTLELTPVLLGFAASGALCAWTRRGRLPTMRACLRSRSSRRSSPPAISRARSSA
ncbi:MAG TPA: hypothetical protein VFB67_04920 [Candidatus Polarisedimenticolaceae bacterium]|nr:hypothetical protein [Candidatus Polarisedimenticolaceae bacterium]